MGREYIPAVEFGKTGVVRDRFDDIFSSTEILKTTPPSRPSNLRPEQYRWMLVDDVVAKFNKTVLVTIIP